MDQINNKIILSYRESGEKYILYSCIMLLLIVLPLSALYSQNFNVPASVEEKLNAIDVIYYQTDPDTWARSRQIINGILPSYSSKRKKAISLNAKGYHYYEDKKYHIACHFFHYAAEADNTYQYGFYNYACSLALMLTPCDYANDLVYQYLSSAIKLDPKYKTKMRRDPDLKIFHTEAWFLILSGADPATAKGLKDILLNTELWYGPQPGAYPASPQIEFHEEGTISIKEINPEYLGGTDNLWISSEGTYNVGSGYISIRINGEEYTGTIGSNGILHIEGLGMTGAFTTTFDCSA
ncbi:MAG: hypothetical protein JW969_01510 [Spirochaetales bacterium]|nr:hypothetical protein [Spirochaetales bacterium]